MELTKTRKIQSTNSVRDSDCLEPFFAFFFEFCFYLSCAKRGVVLVWWQRLFFNILDLWNENQDDHETMINLYKEVADFPICP